MLSRGTGYGVFVRWEEYRALRSAVDEAKRDAMRDEERSLTD